MTTVRSTAGLAGGATLTSAALVHLYWLAGGRAGSAAVIPTIDGRPTFRPGTLATGGVAVALATAGALYAGAGLRCRPRWIFRTGTLGAAAVLSGRAIGDRRALGFSKTRHEGTFARLDTAVLSPLCAALAIAGALATT